MEDAQKNFRKEESFKRNLKVKKNKENIGVTNDNNFII